MTKSAALALFAVLALAPPVRAELPQAAPHSFTSSATPDKVKLGEAFTYTIEIRDEPGRRYQLPAELTLGPGVDVAKTETAREEGDGETLTRFVIEGTLFELGEVKLADLELKASGPEGESVLTIPGPTLTGLGHLDDQQQAELREIAPPVAVAVPSYAILYWAAGAVAAAALVLLLLRWLRRRPHRERLASRAPPKPAHQRALEALEVLQREDLPAQGRAREFHFRLSEIVRGYLGERFALNALELTSDELLAALARMPTPGLDYAALEVFCREGDLVKFAKAPTTPTACKAAIEAAFGFVRATAPQGPAPLDGGPRAQGAAA